MWIQKYAKPVIKQTVDIPTLALTARLNMQTHVVHSKVKPVYMLSKPSSSLHMLRQTFSGSQVTTWAALSLFASKFPLI